MDGVSFAPLLRGAAGVRGAVPIAMWNEDAPYDLLWMGVRSKRYIYVKYPSGERMLYDNHLDPYQARNIADAPGNARLVERLDALAEQLFVCHGPLDCRG